MIRKSATVEKYSKALDHDLIKKYFHFLKG